MKKIKGIFIISAITVFVMSCAKVPITGRSQMKFQSESEIDKMALVEYNSKVNNGTLIQGTMESQMVASVGDRIANAAKEILKSKKDAKRISKYHWQYSLLDNQEANAWCLPGGKIAVYSGILPYTQNEAGLAAAMSHEVAHAIAQHGNEKLSHQKLIQAGMASVYAATSTKTAQTQMLYQAAFGIGTEIGFVLPFSRLQENEADKIGMVLMAKAGYDPHEFINFFERMKLRSTKKESNFFSTHPTDEKRIQNQKEFLSEAMKYYNP